MFGAGADEEPLIGFTIQPSITFSVAEAHGKFVPTANTCICSLVLPHASAFIHLPALNQLFNLYDLHLQINAFFGNA